MLPLLKRIALLGLGLALPVLATAAPKIAVTDLSYEESVAAYFHNVEFKSKYKSSTSERERSSYSSDSSSYNSRENGEVSYKGSSGYQVYIDRGELRKFTGDIKGELIKGGYRVVQGKPWTQKNTEKLYDIISRIKQGYYPGADYVLWGTITNVEFRQDAEPVQGSNRVSQILSLELVGEFSLISTKTFEVKAAFSAIGEGSDVKLAAYGSRFTPNRSKVMLEVTKSLGVAVAEEVANQFGGGDEPRGNVNARDSRDSRNAQSQAPAADEKVTVFK